MVFSLDRGEVYPPWSVLAHRSLHAGVEYSIDAFGSDFSFTRYWLTLDWHVPTLLIESCKYKGMFYSLSCAYLKKPLIRSLS